MRTTPRVSVRDDYLALVRRFPLRAIRSQTEHRAAVAVVAELSAGGDERLSSGEIDYLEALGRFIKDYEKQTVTSLVSNAQPREVLRLLMESHGLTTTELGDILGSRPAATMILKGRREMSKAHIRAAARYFAVSPAVFL